MNDVLKFTEGFCRACLVKYDDPMDLIQYSERNRRLFIYSTGLQVKRNDAFIFQLCKDCVSMMKTASNFKKKCRTSDKKFRSFMGLRNAGDDIDFCSFLKNNDDSHTFRLPFMSGNSTPAFQRAKDDDNASTCTSIRNFMTDILKEDEIPDTEARIIREVIEEEADISEDSLDSHWFQDEISINGDITFDFSFSPFSTPKTGNIDRCQSPKPDLYPQQASTINTDIDNAAINSNFFEAPIKSAIFDIPKKSETCEVPLKIISIPDEQISGKPKYVLNYYTTGDKVTTKCCIDKKLNLALKNVDNQSISLDDLLKSPVSKVLQGKQLPGAETPTINNILFGKSLNNDPMEIKINQIDPDSNILGAKNNENNLNLSDLSLDLKEEIVYEQSEEKPEKLTPEQLTSSCDTENLFCKLCDRKFKFYTGLKVHFRKTHQHIIPSKKSNVKQILVCDYCGISTTDRRNFIRHIKSHEKSQLPCVTCAVCSLTFVGSYNLKLHMISHKTLEERESDKKPDSKHICPECGKHYSSSQNLKVHMSRHGENFKYFCTLCVIGFFRRYDYTVHMRIHSGERPHQCELCNKKFTRRDTYNRHYKKHKGLLPFKCEYCGKAFVINSTLKHHIATSKKCQKKRSELFL